MRHNDTAPPSCNDQALDSQHNKHQQHFETSPDEQQPNSSVQQHPHGMSNQDPIDNCTTDSPTAELAQAVLLTNSRGCVPPTGLSLLLPSTHKALINLHSSHQHTYSQHCTSAGQGLPPQRPRATSTTEAHYAAARMTQQLPLQLGLADYISHPT